MLKVPTSVPHVIHEIDFDGHPELFKTLECTCGAKFARGSKDDKSAEEAWAQHRSEMRRAGAPPRERTPNPAYNPPDGAVGRRKRKKISPVSA